VITVSTFVVIGSCYLVFSLVTASLLPRERIPVGYVFRAEFAELPESDDRFENWLASQKYVDSVVSYRSNGVLVVTFVFERPIKNDPDLPNIMDNLNGLGYKGLRKITWD
jgi:hypothetical protein